MLHDTKPDLSKLHEWGCRLWVHDATGTKRVYWADRRTITVERDVKFDEGSVLLPATVALEGENGGRERVSTAPADTPAPAIPNRLHSSKTRLERVLSANLNPNERSKRNLRRFAGIPKGLQAPASIPEDSAGAWRRHEADQTGRNGTKRFKSSLEHSKRPELGELLNDRRTATLSPASGSSG